MKTIITIILFIYSFQNYNNDANITMTKEELFDIMNAGIKIPFVSEAHLKMTQLSNKAMQI